MDYLQTFGNSLFCFKYDALKFVFTGLGYIGKSVGLSSKETGTDLLQMIQKYCQVTIYQV